MKRFVLEESPVYLLTSIFALNVKSQGRICWLYSTSETKWLSKIHCCVKSHQNLTMNFQVTGNFLSTFDP